MSYHGVIVHANSDARDRGTAMTHWNGYLAGPCILAITLGLEAELVTLALPPLTDCLGVRDAAICQQPNREAVISLHIDSTSETAFVLRF
jgi:hypothetical protein